MIKPTTHAAWLVALLVDGLRYTARPAVTMPSERALAGLNLDTAPSDRPDPR